MEFNNKNANRGLVRFVSMMVVLILCFTMTVQVFATETADGGKATNIAAEEEKSLEGEEVIEEDAVEEEEKTVEGLTISVTAEEMAAAWNALLAEMTAEQAAYHNAAIAAAKAEKALLRSDVKEAIEATAACLRTEKVLEAQEDLTSARIEDSEDLTEEQKTELLLRIGEEKLALGAAPLDALMADVNALLAETATSIDTDVQTGYQAKMEALIGKLSGLDELLDQFTRVIGLQQELQAYISRLSAGDAMTGKLAQSLVEHLEELDERCSAVSGQIAAYLELNEEERTATLENIRTLVGEIEGLSFGVSTNVIENVDAQSEALDALAETVEQMQSLRMLVLVALGVGAVGVIMAVVAVILAAAKSRDKEIDLGVFATREDVETLSRQNADLNRQRSQQEQKLDRMRLELERLSREMKEAAAQPVQDTKPVVIPAAKPEPEPAPAPVVLGSREVVCRLNMVYRHHNPRASCLEVDPEGAYVLYSDDTVELHEETMSLTNTFGGWITNGLTLLFETEVNGQMVDTERDSEPNGYFAVTGIGRRAVVTKIEENRYSPQFRGLVRMKG